MSLPIKVYTLSHKILEKTFHNISLVHSLGNPNIFKSAKFQHCRILYY